MPALEELLDRGGPVVWPLLGLSLLSVTLIVERTLFLLGCATPGRRRRAAEAVGHLRAGDAAAAAAAVGKEGGVLAPVVRAAAAADATTRAAAAATEARVQAARVERLLPWLGLVVTAAPMLGILGTVLGIIASFDALASTAASAGAASAADPRAVGGGIAEALFSTAAGLCVTLLTLPGWVWLRHRADGLLDRLEDVMAAAEGPAAAAAAQAAEKPIS